MRSPERVAYAPPKMIALYYFQLKSFKKILAKNCAERGGGRRQAGACQARQQSYAQFFAIDIKGFYLKIVLIAALLVLLSTIRTNSVTILL